ncbi:hypothetical protein AALO_G00239220 [Alosa alosa]|uniref:Uncharacterized protein n=1 Tax=Alosa alosa TaxID=278164 RepID=A0AAV6FW89_9TELE|nr:hypothetical protein AALO_G00239220 [Alosa alosa]
MDLSTLHGDILDKAEGDCASEATRPVLSDDNQVIRDSDTTESILPGEHALDIPIGVSEAEDTSSRPAPTGSTAATAGESSDVRICHKATEKRRHCDIEDDLTETVGSAKRLYVGVQETIDLTTTDGAIGLGDASINNGVAYSKGYRPIVKTQSEDINRADLWTDTQLETWDINGTDFDDISDWDILNAVEANESCEVHKSPVTVAMLDMTRPLITI